MDARDVRGIKGCHFQCPTWHNQRLLLRDANLTRLTAEKYGFQELVEHPLSTLLGGRSCQYGEVPERGAMTPESSAKETLHFTSILQAPHETRSQYG